ncbi:hypothetical protein ACMU_03785 [Actibacterium mucosum KCTC 23349]|uniref:Cell wall hydrolase SleB domain-containing protein n=1 Tax=Actibacterium mucosum KCTC 23349 TaxID=1454373 RepID=A0A037ZDJ9_9RHOB|nr:cell wall hydrolase [Actibacterium mucosum]KAJ54217.1 hypothetical protein ACMU_03785 [Actibacterium mucosum KCTC 23349]
MLKFKGRALCALVCVVVFAGGYPAPSKASEAAEDVKPTLPLTRILDVERKAISNIRVSRLERLLGLPKVSKKSELGEEIQYDRAWIDAYPKAKGDAQWACLAEALYFEARGESVKGQFAVAEVIMNRVSSSAFPSTVCGVVNQGTGRKYQCQFTYTCDGHDEKIHEPEAFARVGKIAKLMLDGAARPLTDGATHYHTRAVSPRWARQFPRTATIGFHHFYRMPTRVSSN